MGFYWCTKNYLWHCMLSERKMNIKTNPIDKRVFIDKSENHNDT